MLLCGVLCSVLSVPFGAIVQIVIFLLQNSNVSRVHAFLPPGAEDEIIVIEHLPGRRVHLQDFFWTDAEDAPPWVDSNQPFHETKTVHHTVTVYLPADEKDDDDSKSPNRPDSYDPKCTTCIEPTPRLNDDEDQNIGVLIGEDPGPRYWLLTVLRAGEAIPPKIELKLARLYRTAFTRQQQRHLGLLQSNRRFQRAADEQTLVSNKISARSRPLARKQISNDIDGESADRRSELRLFNNTAEGTVQVRMQNTSVTENGATRLIYSVHLGGKPVPAETAARDMALLSSQEVALELGAPVLIQSEPYLKESRPLALSRKRDAWLLIGAASAGFILLAFMIAGLVFTAKRKRSQSSVAAPPNRSILKKKQDHVTTPGGRDNAAFSEMEIKTEGSSQSPIPGSLPRTPVTPESTDSFDLGMQKVSSDNEEELKRKAREPSLLEHPSKKTRLTHGRISRTNAVDVPRTSDSMDVVVDHLEALESLETKQEEAATSPHSYLSMPTCKQFPNMKSVEPLSRVLEPVMIRHLDIDSPELERRDSNDIDPYRGSKVNDKFFARTSSAMKDPGVVGPIVWNLRRHTLCTEGNGTSGSDEITSAGPVGRAKRRLHELLEDSFSLFGSREQNSEMQVCATRPNSAVFTPDVLPGFSKARGKSAYISPVSSPTMEMKMQRPIPLPRKDIEENFTENGQTESVRSHSGWSSRPLSAGPFHRPNVPDIDTRRILSHCQLPPEDPAVPLIASIKKELEKFSS
ncbi:PREDICTED: uncharacterized protein LOC107185360 [Dufourea novaeangliae]|uniref:uncharacterized protein LOC107185360 n=1 Tax=Dufourea novaeangliae TaxID=178035 RepID=UPI000766E57E|nr:PREDICTED: uncharacterized protein LOC107185360 [Dufourea novaeangliae]